jgi:hypothetical protein
MAGFLWGSCFHYLIALRCIYTIPLFGYYPITLYHFYLIVSREDWSCPGACLRITSASATTRPESCQWQAGNTQVGATYRIPTWPRTLSINFLES